MTSTMPTQTLAPARTWSPVLFDLDGTIVDSAADITASSPGEKDPFFAPAADKVYRHPTFYAIPEDVPHL